MNIIFKPFLLSIVLIVVLAILSSQVVSIFLPNMFINYISSQEKTKDIKFDIVNAFDIKEKQQPKVTKQQVTTKTVVEKSGRYLLKAFTISGIIYDGKNSMVIARENKSGVFIYIKDTHKGYKLIKVFKHKAEFLKDGDTYIVFLSPDDEKTFQKIEKKTSTTKTIHNKQTSREKATGTLAKGMFDEIKYKNGKYFIPQSILLEYATLNKIFSGIAIQAFKIDEKVRFKIVHISKNAIFNKMGLKKYDYITQIDNRDFKSMSEPIKFFQNLKNIKVLSLQIERNKQLKELKYEIY